MPKSKSKKKLRKEDKPRPYRVDYFLWEEMLKDKALVRSAVLRAVTAANAKATLLTGLSVRGDGTVEVVEGLECYPPITEFERELSIIRAYRFYKKLSAEPKKKTYIEVAKLLPAKKVLAVMDQIDNNAASVAEFRMRMATAKAGGEADVAKEPIVIRPEDLGIEPQKAAEPVVSFEEIDPSKEVMSDVRATVTAADLGGTLVPTVMLPPETPRSGYWIGKCSGCGVTKELVCETSWCDDCIAQGAGLPKEDLPPSPYRFPNQPAVPVKDAVFDGPKDGEYPPMTDKVRRILDGEFSCRWHGSRYIDSSDGRCTALDPGSEYLKNLYNKPVKPHPQDSVGMYIVEQLAASGETVLYTKLEDQPPVYHTDETETPALGEVGNFDLDKAAPVVQKPWEPSVNIPSMDEMREAMKADPCRESPDNDGPAEHKEWSGEKYPPVDISDAVKEALEMKKPFKVTIEVFVGAVIVIVGLVYVFFKFAK